MTENPARTAEEAWRRANPHREDDLDEAYAKFDGTEPEPEPEPEQMELADGDRSDEA